MKGPNVKIFLYFAPRFFNNIVHRKSSFDTTFAKATVVKESFGGQRERCKSGLIGTPGKRVYLKRVPGVRIPLSPQSLNESRQRRDFLFY